MKDELCYECKFWTRNMKDTCHGFCQKQDGKHKFSLDESCDKFKDKEKTK